MLNPNRYRLYREHKYICFCFDSLLKMVARMDFCKSNDVMNAKRELNNLQQLLQEHAKHEEQNMHRLLKLKQSDVYHIAENHHQEHARFFEQLTIKFNLLENTHSSAEKDFIGYEIYLGIRQFYADNLYHFDYEERVLMPELQKHYNDEELKAIDQENYRQMSPQQIIDMLGILFPHMNHEDRNIFLTDIKACVPDKFVIAWPQIVVLMEQRDAEIANVLE